MPDWGMWDMNYDQLEVEAPLIAIDIVKSYNSFGNYWYDGDKCPACNVMLSHDNTDYNPGRNGLTCNGGSAGQQKKVRYCNEDYLKRLRKGRWKYQKKVVTFLRPSNIAPFSYPPEHEKRLIYKYEKEA